VHAVYCFLCKGDQPMQIFEGSSFWIRLDENNWYQEMCAVSRNGEVTEFCPSDDFRGRDSLGSKFQAQAQGSRWQGALEFAQGCVLWDINQALSALDEESPEIVRLEDAEGALRQKLAANAQARYPWALSQAAQVIEQLDDRVGPFTCNLRDAYDTLRAMVLSEDVALEDPDATILFVDIHT
jgi:hypothetical protein